MCICFNCGNNLSGHVIHVNEIYGKSSHERFFKYKKEKDMPKETLEEYFIKHKLSICCTGLLTTYINNLYLHHMPN